MGHKTLRRETEAEHRAGEEIKVAPSAVHTGLSYPFSRVWVPSLYAKTKAA
jgi:hypothetical protein